MKVKRVEQTIIRKSHIIWRTIDEMCFNSKNLYNYANFLVRQRFKGENEYLNSNKLNKELKSYEVYKLCMSQPANCTLRSLEKAWMSFFKSIKSWKINKEKYNGMPNLPKFLNKNGRYPWMIPNNSCYLENNELKFRIKKLQGQAWKTNAKGRLIQVRFVPRGTCYVMEIVTEVEIYPEFKEPKRIVGIDLGVDNFATISNNIGIKPIIINGRGIKSINQFYNKQRSYYVSLLTDVKWSNRLSDITMKRFNRIKNFMHHASNEVIRYCKENEVDTVVCGLNRNWKYKSNIGKRNNQKFQQIPFDMFIKQLKYKCQEKGINFITTDEAYTSGTSFLDNELPIKENYDKKRRKHRGLFKSETRFINADVNGSMQIIKKVFPNTFNGYGIGACLTPSRINLVSC